MYLPDATVSLLISTNLANYEAPPCRPKNEGCTANPSPMVKD